MIDQKISDLLQSIDGFDSHQILGKVSKLIGLVIEASGLNCSMGEMCQIIKPDGSFVDAEVVGFNDQNVLQLIVVMMLLFLLGHICYLFLNLKNLLKKLFWVI